MFGIFRINFSSFLFLVLEILSPDLVTLNYFAYKYHPGYCFNGWQAMYWKTVEEGHPAVTVEMMQMSTSQCGSGFPSARESPYSK